MMLVGWPQIVRFLCSGCKETGIGEWPKMMAEERKSSLIAAGIPVFYLPELDDDPRVMTTDLVKWMKAREVQRRAAQQ